MLVLRANSLPLRKADLPLNEDLPLHSLALFGLESQQLLPCDVAGTLVSHKALDPPLLKALACLGLDIGLNGREGSNVRYRLPTAHWHGRQALQKPGVGQTAWSMNEQIRDGVDSCAVQLYVQLRPGWVFTDVSLSCRASACSSLAFAVSILMPCKWGLYWGCSSQAAGRRADHLEHKILGRGG